MFGGEKLEKAAWRGKGADVGTASSSAVRNGWRNPAVLLVGLHEALERGFGFLATEGFLGLSRFPADPALGVGQIKRDNASKAGYRPQRTTVTDFQKVLKISLLGR